MKLLEKKELTGTPLLGAAHFQEHYRNMSICFQRFFHLLRNAIKKSACKPQKLYHMKSITVKNAVLRYNALLRGEQRNTEAAVYHLNH
ncbi:hypothetical protein ACPSLZ_06640 [Vibrio campbellii]|uniref:hypothetical protein n=1 Tax=Vibrio campbellii TaxID=680 RepID=UPI003CE45773